MLRTASIGVRMSPDVKDALERAAKADARTVSQYVELLIVEKLREKKFLPPAA